jgi:hypothetical protein
MHRAHIEIERLIGRLGAHAQTIQGNGPDPLDMADLRSILYGLDAILRLHFTQEDESYVALLTAHAAEG